MLFCVVSQNESSKDEVKEVLQALEELAVNYDQKSQELETKNRDFELQLEELQSKNNALNSATAELALSKENSGLQRKRANEMLSNLLKDLNEIGIVLGTSNSPNSPQIKDVDSNKIDDEFTVARLHIR